MLFVSRYAILFSAKEISLLLKAASSLGPQAGHHCVVQHRQAAKGVQLIAELPPPQRPFFAEA